MDASARTPTHLWIVGVLSALWNAYGAYDYVMTQTRNEAYLAMFTAEQRAYFDGFPAWTEAFWALGVWGALLGSLLLLIRSRFAVWSFALSLLGLAVTSCYQFLLSSMPADMARGIMLVMTIVIWIVAIALLTYSVRMKANGVLR